MEAKDTVKRECICGSYDFEPFYSPWDVNNTHLNHCYECDAYNDGKERQAEISFKAGRDSMITEAKSIEKIAEELEVNFYDLCPLIIARDEFHYEKGYNKALAQLADMTEECKQMGIKEVVDRGWIVQDPEGLLDEGDFIIKKEQVRLKEWNVKTE